MPEKTIIRSTDSSGNMNTAMPAMMDKTPERIESPRLWTAPVSMRVTTPSMIQPKPIAMAASVASAAADAV